MMNLTRAALALAAALLLAGCPDHPSIVGCSDSTVCTLSAGGQCLPAPVGFDVCAYPSTECPSGFSWSPQAGDLAGQCVAADIDAGTADIDAGTDAPTIDARACNLRLTFQEGSEVWVANYDGTGLLNLSVNASADEAPRWAPDGNKVVFVSRRTGNDEVFTVNATGTGLLNLTMNAADDQQPAWAPDGNTIAFIRNDRVWVMDANGANARALSSTLMVYGFDPLSWSADSTRIAVVSGGDIYTLALSGGSPSNVTRSAARDDSPEWSPDGTKIAFRSAAAPGSPEDVWVINTDGNGPINISQTPTATEALPQWSPDSLAIVFSSNRAGNSEIYSGRLSAPGQNQRLTNTPYPELMPAWAPNGTRLAFVLEPEAGSGTTIGVVDASGGGLVPFALTNSAALRPLWAPCD